MSGFSGFRRTSRRARRAVPAAAIGLLAALAGCDGGGTPGQQPGGTPSPRPAADHLELSYTTTPRRLLLDLHTPAGTPPFPVLVWIHGGAWVSGDRALFPGHPALRQRDRGWAVATIQYRFATEASFPAQIHDAKAAVRWLRANAGSYGLDPARVVAWGASAGGHLAALLGTSGGLAALEDAAQGNPGESSRVQGVVDWFGPTDWRLVQDDPRGPEALLLGCTWRQCPEKAALASPVSHVDAADPPFLIQHGDADTTVDLAHSQVLHATLAAAGVHSTLTVLPGAGHGTLEFLSAENTARIDAFLDALRGTPAR